MYSFPALYITFFQIVKKIVGFLTFFWRCIQCL